MVTYAYASHPTDFLLEQVEDEMWEVQANGGLPENAHQNREAVVN